MDKKIEQLCQSDLITTKNLLHIIDSIEYTILDHHFKYIFFSSIMGTKDKYIKFDDEVSRICKVLKEINDDSFRALLLIQGKDKDDEKELEKLLKFLVEWRYASLINQETLTMSQLGTGVKHTMLNTIDRKTLNIIDRLIHVPEHEQTMEDADKAMKAMMDNFANMSKGLLGDEFKGADMNKLFDNINRSGKIDLSKILGTETKENVDILKDDKKDD